MTATSWGETVRCTVPKSSNIAATCSRPARYLYMAGADTLNGAPVQRRRTVDGHPDALMIWAECAQHRRNVTFATMIRPRTWEYSYLYDASAHGRVAGAGIDGRA